MQKKHFTTNQERMRVQYEERERYVFKQLLDTYIRNKHPEYTYECHISNINTGCPYDTLLFIRDKDDNIVKKYFVEIKVRSVDYGDKYFLEQRKLNSLKKEQKFHNDYELLYVQFTPKRTLIFPLSEMIENKSLGKRKIEMMNAYTFADTQNKRNKMIYELDENDAIELKYAYSDEEFDKWYKSRNEIKQPVIKKTTKVESLF